MTRTYGLVTLLLSALVCCSNGYSENMTPALPYFGQTPPGDTPQLFAPDTVSVAGRHEFGISFSPALDEMYFSAKELDKPTQI